MSFTDHLENELLDHVFRNASYTPAATVYVALFTTATDDTGAGTEVSGGSYARQSVTFGAAAAGAISNSAEINFPTATANWGTITHAAIMDASTGGNMLAHTALDASKSINTNDVLRFAIGEIDITLD